MTIHAFGRRYRLSMRLIDRWHTAVDRQTFKEGTCVVVRAWLGPIFFKALIDDKYGVPQERMSLRQLEWLLKQGPR